MALPFFLLLAVTVHQAFAWYTHGLIKPKPGSRLYYVGKFCYDVQAAGSRSDDPGGLLDVNVRGLIHNTSNWQPELPHKGDDTLPGMPDFPPAPGGLYLAIFSDAVEEWPTVRSSWHTITVEEVLDRAIAVRAVTPVLPAGKFDANVYLRERQRPRFLYFTFVFWASAQANSSVPLRYTIHAENLQSGYEREFSVEERGAIALHTTSALAFTALLVLVVLFTRIVFGESALRVRPLLRLLLVSTAFTILECLLRLVHEGTYAENGVGVRPLDVLGVLAACVAKLLLISVQIYIANGNALLASEDQAGRRQYLGVLVAGVVATSVGCEVYARYFSDMDWSTTLYFYESWPGLTLLGFNSLIFLDICCSTWTQFKAPENSRLVQRFYIFAFSAAVLYFATVPSMCYYAKSLHPWDRQRTIRRTEMLVRFTVTFILFMILRPSRLDKMINARIQTGDSKAISIELTQA